MIKFLEDGPWRPQSESPSGPLQETISADVAVIGAGVTGLATAMELAERGYDVVVLEQKWVGYGASGRNAGHQASMVNEQLLMLKRFVGEQALRDYVALLKEAVSYMSDFIDTHKIDCDHRITSSLLVGTASAHNQKVKRITSEMRSLGADVSFVDQAEMRDRDLPEAFKCAMWGEGGVYNPFKYVDGIRKLAESKGVRIFEQTEVQDLIPGGRVVLKTPGGNVLARKVFLATNAYTPALGFKTLPRRKVLPVYPSLVETEPLTDEQWSRVGWSGREAVCTADARMESYHPSASSNSIVLGTVAPQIGFRSSMNYQASERVLREQERAFRRRFPMLDDVKIQHGWGGWVAMTTNFMPKCSRLEGSDNVFYAMAYQGHGIPKATLMGQIASDMVEGKDYRYQSMFTQNSMNWPLEPLRYIGFYAMDMISRLVDYRQRT